MLLGVLALPIVLILAVTVHDSARRPTLRRLAFRNANRRRGEAVLVLLGSMLGTAIICASLIAGDSLRASIRDFARTQLGPIDETVVLNGLTHLDAAVTAVGKGGPLPGTDGGPLRMVVAGGTAAVPVRSPFASPPRAEPHAALVEVDFDAARKFGGDAAATGLDRAGPTPVGDDVVMTEPLARSLRVGPGGRVDAFAYGGRLALRVRRIVPELGLAGYWEGDGRALNLFVAPGTIERLVAVAAAASAAGSGRAGAIHSAPPEGLVLISNTGGVFAGAAGSVAVKAELQRRLAGLPGAEVDTVKADQLRRADENGAGFRRLFSGMAAFSVIAGILLLVNIFVMLAEERKTELGMLRAVGMKRNHLVRAFGMEGVLYGLVAAAVGALAGIGLGRLIVWVAAGVFRARSVRTEGISLRFAAQGSSVLVGAAIGLAISLLTVWGASLRIGNLNVIRAIRDLPEPVVSRRRLRSLVLSGVGVVTGTAMIVAGVTGRAWFPTLVGPVVALWSAMVLVRGIVPRRLAATIAGVLVIAWGATCFTLVPGAFHNTDIPTFVVQGVALVTAAVVVVAVNDEVFVLVADRLSGSGRALAARLGLAYPLARKFRTGMTLVMYALVIFTLTFLTIFSKLFQDQAPHLANDSRAGYDVIVDSNPAAPAAPSLLLAQPEVTAVAPLIHASPEFTTDVQPTKDRWELTGFDQAFLAHGTPKLSHRAPGYPSDRSTWEAVLGDSSLVIVPSFFLQHGPSTGSGLEPGQHVTVYDDRTGRTSRLTIAGIASADRLFMGAMVSSQLARDVLGAQAVVSRLFVQVRPGLEPAAVAQRLNGRLLAYGVDASGISQRIRDSLRQQQGFFRLIQGFLALGLIVGVAGLGVIMVRAVRERRRQIGMLRAMGFSGAVVRAAFLFEAVFIAVQGMLIGALLAMVTSYEVLTRSRSFGGEQLHFAIPWLGLVGLLGAALGASLVSTLAPAAQAARVRPAVALRVAD